MQTRKQIRLLVTGPSGCGKTSIINMMQELRPDLIGIDLDNLGTHQVTPGGREAWIVDGRIFATMAEAAVSYIAAGMCRNMFIAYGFMVVDWRKTLGPKKYSVNTIPREPLAAKPIAYAYDWTHRVLLTYEPNDSEMSRRFSSRRTNPWGKDPVTRKQTIDFAGQMHVNPAPRGFTKLDTTGLGLREVAEAILTIVDGGEPKVKPVESGRTATAIPSGRQVSNSSQVEER